MCASDSPGGMQLLSARGRQWGLLGHRRRLPGHGRQRAPGSRPTTVSPSERPAAALGPPPSGAQLAPFRQARPTFSPASIKLPLCPLAGGSCARARSLPTIYTPVHVTRASQSPAPSLGPQPTQPIRSQRGQRPGWNEPENRPFRLLPRLQGELTFRRPGCCSKFDRWLKSWIQLSRQSLPNIHEALDSVLSTSEDRARRCSTLSPRKLRQEDRTNCSQPALRNKTMVCREENLHLQLEILTSLPPFPATPFYGPS